VKIAIGSLRPPKINAVKSALAKLQQTYRLGAARFDYQARSVDSAIASMPLSTADLMLGAFNRAQALEALFQDEDDKPAFYVGMEGGFFQQPGPGTSLHYFLQSWVYVSDGAQGFFGASCAVPVPDSVSATVVRHHQELGEIIDGYGGEKNIRNKHGAFGVFTKGLVSREQAFEQALINAFSVFFNREIYSPSNE